ncbi:MAG: ADP-ribose pyrophosphatase, partial [Candidatus Thiodiazotropha sp. 6PLUC4]
MKYRYKIQETTEVFRGFLKLNRYKIIHDLFLGGQSEPIVRERLEDIGAVSVLLYDPQHDKVVLVEQFRIGAAGFENPPWLLETIGGLQ